MNKPKYVYRLKLYNRQGKSAVTPSGYALKRDAKKIAGVWRKRTGGKVNILRQKTPKGINIIRNPVTNITSQRWRRKRGRA